MTKETELKLRLQPQSAQALAQFLNTRATAQGHSTLKNWYLDTPAAEVAAARAALRIRQHDNGYEQTLKTRGVSVAGMQQRGEWNWPLSQPTLNTDYLRQPEVTEHWPAGLDVSALAEVFTTHFERQAWLWTENGCSAEVVIDQGEIRADGKTMPLCEVELELKDGDAAGLWQMASALTQQVPLWLSDISKAERGYRLAGLSRPWQAQPDVSADMDLAHAIPALLQYEFQQFKRGLETCLWDADTSHADILYSHWHGLRNLPTMAGKVLKRRQTRALREALDEFEAPLARLEVLGQLQGYLQAADAEVDIRAELKAVSAQQQQIIHEILSSPSLASALLQVATELFHLPALCAGADNIGHWLRQGLQNYRDMVTQLHSERPQTAEKWRALLPAGRTMQQLLDYSRVIPEASKGLQTGDGTLRLLGDINAAQCLLKRPWPVADDDQLRSVDEYTEWALEHLSQLARQL
tara:strand:- start:23011 stop:24411 length:1401 start_codon:yes stop_codon:yes gene_type:complete